MKNIIKVCRAILLSFMLFNVVSCSEGGREMNIDESNNISETSVSSEESIVSVSSEEKIYELNEILAMCAEHVVPNTYHGSYVCYDDACDFNFMVGMTIRGELAKRYYSEPQESSWEISKYYRFATEKYYLNETQYLALEFVSSEKQDIQTTDIITLKVTGIKVVQHSICFTYELINIER